MLNVGVLLFPFFLGVGLLAPGWILGRALRTPAGLPGAFLGSAGLLLNVILLLDALDVTLTSLHLALCLAAICLMLAAVAKIHGRLPETPRFLSPWREFKWRTYHWFLLPAVIGLVAVTLKASLDPLSGPDTVFRWDFLAVQMVREGNLHFYPSVTPDDFLHYGWCDGISPVISDLYFWSYLSFGETNKLVTAPIVILQMVLLFQVVYELATKQGSHAAGCVAMAVLATSSILLSGIAIGQETGLTALALVAMFLFIEKYREREGGNWLVWAGVAAGLGALAREYGLAFFALGALRLMQFRVSGRKWVHFLGSALVIMGPWYVRNWVKTGNPLYSHELLHLFPTNPVYVEYMRIVNGTLNFGSNPSAVRNLMSSLLTLACVPIALAIPGIFQRRQLWPWLAAVIFICGFWLWSAGRTAGGYNYSLRVLTPALAFGSVYGGLFLARWSDKKRGWILAVFLGVVAIDAGGRALYVPYNFPGDWWREKPAGWLKIRDQIDWWNHRPYWAEQASAAGESRILVTDPYTHAFLINLNATPVSYFSPAVRYLFEPNADYQACCARLRSDGIRFILLPPENFFEIGSRQLSSHRFFSKLREKKPSKTTPAFVAYDLCTP